MFGFKLSDKQKNNLSVFACAAFVLFIVYCGFMNHSFTSDHVKGFMLAGVDSDYTLYGRPSINPWGYIRSLSWMYYFIDWIQYFFYKIGVTKDVNQFVLQILLILLVSYVVAFLYDLFKGFFEDKEKRIVIFVVLLLTFINPFFCEVFVYVAWEKILGVIAAVWGVKFFTKGKYIRTFLCIVLAVTTYQVYYVLFLIYASTWIYLKYNGNVSKSLLLAYIKMYGVMIGPPLISICAFWIGERLGINIYSGKTIPMGIGIGDRIIWFKKMLVSMMVTQMGLLPSKFLLYCFVLCGILTLVCFFNRRATNAIFAIAHTIAMGMYPVSIFIVATNSSTFGRIVWPVFAALSGLVVLIVYGMQLKSVKKNWLRIGKCALIIYTCIVVFATSSTITNIYKSNALDEQIVRQVVGQIDLYQAQTGISVQKIAARANPNSRNSYDQVGFLGMDYSNLDAGYYNFTHKAMKDGWSDDELFIYLTKRPYAITDMDETIWNEHFAGRGWETFVPQEQLYFEGDTLYWCIY